MLKILVTYAVQGEFVDIKWPDAEFYYVRTGIGKVKSTFHLAEAIRQVQPDLVLNIGTAGTVNHEVGTIFVCRQFVDRDMQKLSDLGMECEIDTSALLEAKGFCRDWTETGVCNTGDGFLTELVHVAGDVVDMEAFAQAFVCRSKEIPFISVKYVTDVIGQNSVKHWEDKLADARTGLAHFFNVLKERI
ncbi:5'-methylthioadenosine/S-adenosylhomocysteine nucleosidase family protein [Bacteroides reticulotermitis]|uniref:5'-methylthioadenosine nucleosidase n=2 Tax=Bacteroides reticulotermitis TaxID=1133319 RepID=W4UXI4_9BACE|nr:MTA/SAH nucleosidase [Bacteroides reticulotermitis]MBB4042717.1 adenosylhomocysteine nucleosidase [Bacteroides reticulotermitis]GAE85318.1 5'-methylthioadenosine nucleosidase [Bacteroides reticulotermitis JCM 10512]